MKKDQNKKGIVALLSLAMAAALLGGAAVNLLVIAEILAAKWIWLGMVLICAASVGINIASVSKRNRKDEDNIATISKPFAVALVSVAMLWVLTLVLALVM